MLLAQAFKSAMKPMGTPASIPPAAPLCGLSRWGRERQSSCGVSSAGRDFFFVPADCLRYNASMTVGDPDSGTAAAQGPRFATTCWSVVVAARHAESDLAHQALATLCSAYWYPLYANIRRQGHPAHEAEDLTQVFARIVEKGFLADVGRAKGKFRSFLTTACAHFLAYARLSPELGMSSGAVRVAVHRLRQQFRELLREESGRTVENPHEVEDEIRDLFAALGP